MNIVTLSVYSHILSMYGLYVVWPAMLSNFHYSVKEEEKYDHLDYESTPTPKSFRNLDLYLHMVINCKMLS